MVEVTQHDHVVAAPVSETKEAKDAMRKDEVLIEEVDVTLAESMLTMRC